MSCVMVLYFILLAVRNLALCIFSKGPIFMLQYLEMKEKCKKKGNYSEAKGKFLEGMKGVKKCSYLK